MLGIRRFGSFSFLPGGERVVHSFVEPHPAGGWSSRIALVDWSSGASRRLTTGESWDENPQGSPDGRRLLFVRWRGDRQGLAILHLEGGEATWIPVDGYDVVGAAWHPAGRRISVVARPAPALGSFVEVVRSLAPPDDAGGVLLEIDVESGRIELLHEEPRSLDAPAWSPDGTRLFVRRRADESHDRRGPLFDLVCLEATGTLRTLVAREPIGPPRPAPSGKLVACREELRREGLSGILLVDAASGDRGRVATDLDRPIGDPVWYDEGGRLALPVAERGSWRIVTLDTEGGAPRPLGAPAGVGRILVSDGRGRGALLFHETSSPPELWGIDLHSGVRRKLTSLQPAAPASSGWAVAEPFEVEIGEGLVADSWLVLPDRKGGETVPAVLQVAAGSPPMAGPGFSSVAQALALRGIATISGNPRGSDGAGIDHIRAAGGDPLGIAARDSESIIEEASEEFPFLDPARIALLGEGAGAAVVLWLLARSEGFRGGALVDGFYDPLLFSLISSEPWAFPVERGADLPASAPALWAASPLRVAGRIRVPLLAFHDELDRRSPAVQARALFGLLPVEGSELLLAKACPGPPSQRRANVRADRLRRMTEWLVERLG